MANTKIPVELSSTPGIVDNSNATAITINSSETVMIGKTADNTTDVGVVNGSTGYIYATRDGNIPLVLNRKTSDGTIQQFRKDNTTIGSVAALQSLLGIGNGDAGLLIAGSVDAVAPYNSTTNATRDAAINLGTATNRFQNIFLSGGAYIGGTDSANYLDDYEEGTFTPTITSGITSVGYGVQAGYYTKIGNLVMFNLRVTTSSGNAQSSTFAVGNLPFTSAATQQPGGVAIRAYASQFTNSGSQAFIGPDSTSVSFFNLSGTAFAGTSITDHDGFDLRITGIYRA
jgi:hypothetical protein